MINETEIRVGNWFKHNSGWSYRNDELVEHLFQWDARDWYALGECTMYLSNLEPILITPEILESAGFGWCDSKWIEKSEAGQQKLSIQISNLETLDYEDGEFHICGVNNHDVVTFWYEIRYLHQIQNLYYALTGSELEIKAMAPSVSQTS